MEVKINKGQNLKKVLEAEGYLFPCVGKGLCGKCKIIAKDIEPTQKDKNFFSKQQLEEGYRIACDKVATNDTIIHTLMEKRVALKPEHPGLIVTVERDKIELIFVGNGEILEILELDNPGLDRISLQGVIGTEAIELYEKYSLALAETLMLIGDYSYIKKIASPGVVLEGTKEAKAFMLPAVDVYVPPFVAEQTNLAPIYTFGLDGEFLLRLKDYMIVRKERDYLYAIDDGEITLENGNKICVDNYKALAMAFDIESEKCFSLSDEKGYILHKIDKFERLKNILGVYRQRTRYENQLRSTMFVK